MPRFRVNNLSVSLSDKFGNQELIPTPQTWFHCNWPFSCHWWPTNCHWWHSCNWGASIFCHWWPSVIQCPFNSTMVVDCPAGTQIVDCPGGSVIQDTKDILINPAIEAERLDQMREQLQAALRQVEEKGAQLAEYTKPRTKAQAKAMEEQLNAALEELKRMNEDLE